MALLMGNWGHNHYSMLTIMVPMKKNSVFSREIHEEMINEGLLHWMKHNHEWKIRIVTFLVGNPNLSLYLPLLLRGE